MSSTSSRSSSSPDKSGRQSTRQVSSGTVAAKVKAKVAATSRPHTLRIQQASSPTHHSHLNARHRDSSMASDESIGTCSLDADVTASEASECVDAGTISARTLQSLPLSLRTPEADSIQTNKPSGEAVTPEYVKRTARLFETSPDGTPNPVGTQSPDSSVPKSGGKTTNIPSAILVNGTNSSKSSDILNGDSSTDKKPSYLGLACSISGYSGITKYDSKLREGFRSRDHSPGRIGLIKSRDVSPLRPSSVIEAGDGHVTYKSDCGNFLVAPTSKQTVQCVNGDTKLDSKRTMEEKSFTDIHHAVNGISNKMGRTTLDGDEKPWGASHAGDGYSMTSKQEFFSKSSSAIRESTRNFMSSMLETDSSFSSTYYESSVTQSRDTTDFKDSQPSSVPQEGLGYYSPVATFSPESPKTVPKESPGSRKTMSPRDSSGLSSPLKHSPESPKTSSKDSLSAPVTSPQKRSPGAVRVVEFTSQAKSYVRTTFVSSGSVESTTVTTQGYTESPGARAYGDGSQLKTYIHTSSSSVETLDNATPSSKSFIQQRVERLYGPGALAQGFFKRTRHKTTEEVEGSPNISVSSTTSPRLTSSPALPVLRHLRPEFRAQLSLNPAVKKVVETKEDQPVEQAENREAAERLSLDTIPALQQQVSVESVTDLQPAAPEVVLPIEQSQAQPSETLQVTESETQEKDGHYFLKLLKQEIERLNGLVEEVEADLAIDEALPEEALGKLRAASGQARLLIRQKLQQFEGLCHKNIAQSSEEPFPTTSEDLAGFWDMVMLQVEHVNRLFEEIAKLRAANWIEAKDTAKATKKRVLKRPATAPVKTSASSEAARKAREEGRRKMMEERRKAMREKRDAASSSSQVEIFVPQENGK